MFIHCRVLEHTKPSIRTHWPVQQRIHRYTYQSYIFSCLGPSRSCIDNVVEKLEEVFKVAHLITLARRVFEVFFVMGNLHNYQHRVL